MTDPTAADSEMGQLARKLFDALETADVETLKSLYAPGATLWTNVSQRRLPAEAVASFLPRIAKKMPDRTYADRRVSLFPGGFVHRHRLTGTRADGARVAAECCAIVLVEGGRVASIEEYVDSRQLEALSG